MILVNEIKKRFETEEEYREFLKYCEDNGFTPITKFPKLSLRLIKHFKNEKRN